MKVRGVGFVPCPASTMSTVKPDAIAEPHSLALSSVSLASSSTLGWLPSAALALVLAAVTTSLQGCDVPLLDGYFANNVPPVEASASVSAKKPSHPVPTHSVAYWRQKESYWEKYSFKAPNGHTSFNSCMDPQVDHESVCSGNGYCLPYEPNNLASPVFFCKCNEGYGGIECRVRLKRQSIAWVLSLTLGFVAADEIYLAHVEPIIVKILLTTIGLTVMIMASKKLGLSFILVPWFYDIVRIGTGRVVAIGSGNVVTDVPRWVFVVFTIIYAALLSMGIGIAFARDAIIKRRLRYENQINYGTPDPKA